VESFSEFKIKDYLRDLASAKPSPGGGSAAGIVTALGCGLISKVAVISQAKNEESNFDSEIQEAETLQKASLKLSDLDAEVYADVVKAYKVKATTDDEKSKRRDAIDEALKKAFDVPYQLLEIIKKGESLRKKLLKKTSGAIASDLDVAENFFGGAHKSTRHLAEGNLACIKNETIKNELKKMLETL